jgi:hypothetical protein
MTAFIVITPAKGKSFIEEFDPSRESQAEVERRHGVSCCECYADRVHAERALNMSESYWSRPRIA